MRRAMGWCVVAGLLWCVGYASCTPTRERPRPDASVQQDGGVVERGGSEPGALRDLSSRPEAAVDTGAPADRRSANPPDRREGSEPQVTPDRSTPPEPQTKPDTPGCQPKTCGQLGKDCGQVADGCGKQLSCGTCKAPQSCGGGGVANVCGAPAKDLCKAIEDNPNWQLCGKTANSCTAVFTDGAGCAKVCASVGMRCAEVWEDAPNCSKDSSRPALSCAGSGHQSDWCKCVKPGGTCTPNCAGKSCGDNGCGGRCGTCKAGETCDAGACKPGSTSAKEDCSKYPFKSSTLLAERAGFGASTTGGSYSRIYRVKNLKDSGSGSLRAGLESPNSQWIAFDVNGTIKLSSQIRIRSNKTVDGRGRSIKIEGGGFRIDAGVKNVIISDITITNPKGDGIDIRGNVKDSKNNISTRNFWFHHLEMYKSGDGLIDIWHAATHVTMSWNYFHDHAKAILVGADSRYASVDAGIKVTFHHNRFYRTTRRNPRFRFGLADFYNNYIHQFWEYGAGSFSGAQLLSENNIYEARPGTYCFTPCPDPNTGDTDFTISKKGLVNDWANQGLGFTRSVGDLLLNGATTVVHQPTKVFQRSTYYKATPDKADDALKKRLLSDTGPRTRYCKP